MKTVILVRIAVAVIGIVLCCLIFIAYSRQRLMEKMAFLWGVFGFALILAGVVPGLSGWARVLAPRTCVALIMLLIVLLWLLYAMSITISDLSAKTQELAMQVSLLNNENEQLIKQMKNLTKEQEKRR